MDQNREKICAVEMSDDWLTVLIREELYSRVAGCEPPVTIWALIQRRIETAPPSLPRQEEIAHGGAKMFDRYVFDLAAQRHRKLLSVAAQDRFIRQALAGASRGERLSDRTLAWLGQRLVIWGWYLQERFGAAAPNLTMR